MFSSKNNGNMKTNRVPLIHKTEIRVVMGDGIVDLKPKTYNSGGLQIHFGGGGELFFKCNKGCFAWH